MAGYRERGVLRRFHAAGLSLPLLTVLAELRGDSSGQLRAYEFTTLTPTDERGWQRDEGFPGYSIWRMNRSTRRPN